MIHSSIENFQPELKLNSEPQPIVIPSAQVLPMQCYVQPFWKHSDIEIYNESNFETMARMPDNYIDLTVTSPPYDGLRTYNGYSFDFENVAKELLRVTKKGGVVCWVVNDATVNGSESGTSFRQALYFKEIGFNIHDTMIYKKKNYVPLTHNRYEQCFEYMFVFSKGKPKTFNAIMVKTLTEGDRKSYNYVCGTTNENSSIRSGMDRTLTIKDKKIKENVFEYTVGKNQSAVDDVAFEHPAIFPEQLAADQIYSWSNENDIIYEPFGGSGTVAKMCHLMNRKCVMSEISKEYCELSVKRITPYVQQQRLFV